MAVFTLVSLAVQGYVTNDLYSQIKRSATRIEELEERSIEVLEANTRNERLLTHYHEKQDVIVELARAVTTEVVGLRGEVFKRCRR